MLGQLLRDELPGHGLPAYAVHLGYSHSLLIKQEQSHKHSHSALAVDLVLVLPQTIHWSNDTRWDAELIGDCLDQARTRAYW